MGEQRFTFDRFGRSYHLRIRGVDDLRRALELDRAHWVATSAPINTLHLDGVLLDAVDMDRDGRIRAHELTRAIAWTLETLEETAGVEAGRRTLTPAAIRATGGDGPRLRQAIEKINLHRGAEPDAAIALADLRRVRVEVESRPVSEAGVVLPEAAIGESTAQFITDVIMTVGGEPHPSGRMGLTAPKLEQFLAEAAGFLAWQQRGRIPDGQTRTDVLPFGAATAGKFGRLTPLRGKLDQFFAQCEAVAHDPALASRFGPGPGDYAARDLNRPEDIEALLRLAPIAPPNAERVLDFDAKLNPAYADALQDLRREVIEPVLGGPVARLDEAGWSHVKQAFAAYAAWQDAKVGQALATLGEAKLRQYLQPEYAAKARALIDQSRAVALSVDDVRLVEKLLLHQAHLIELANNFVSFPHLYRRGETAAFDAGDLVMDGRRFNLAVRVHHRAEHAAIAQTSSMYVIYLEITGPGVPAYEVAAAVTSGGVGNLCVGKRGIFYDRAGRELDARIVQLIDNPISLREAMVEPFRRLGRAVAGKIESITGSAEKQLDQTGAQVVTDVQTTTAPAPGSPASGAPAAPAPIAPTGAGMGGVLAGGGIAVAALGSSLAYITKTLAALAWWKIAAGVGGAIAAVILPTIIVAVLKLRRRDLSAILEGAGWAVNARMRLDRRQSRYFTERPDYPRGSRGVRRHWFGWLVALALLIALIVGVQQWYQRRPAAATQPATPAAEPGPSTPPATTPGPPDTAAP